MHDDVTTFIQKTHVLMLKNLPKNVVDEKEVVVKLKLPNSETHFTNGLLVSFRKFLAYSLFSNEYASHHYFKSDLVQTRRLVCTKFEFLSHFTDVRGVLKGRLPKKLFRVKAKELYDIWMKRQPIPIPLEDQLKFSDPWIKSWMTEYGVSLKKPNKRFSIKQEDRITRLLEYLKNVMRVRYFFLEKYKVDPPIINGDQMPLHRNESCSLKTMNIKNLDVYVKENYMLSRERVTCFTQFSSDKKIKLNPEFVFKGKGES